MLTNRTHACCENPAKTAIALLPVVHVCPVAPLGKASRPATSSITAFPVPARDILSLRSIAAQAEPPCKHRNVNPTACHDPPSIPTTASPPSPLAIADLRNAWPGARHQVRAGGLIAFRAGRGGAWQEWCRDGAETATNNLRWILSVPPLHCRVF